MNHDEGVLHSWAQLSKALRYIAFLIGILHLQAFCVSGIFVWPHPDRFSRSPSLKHGYGWDFDSQSTDFHLEGMAAIGCLQQRNDHLPLSLSSFPPARRDPCFGLSAIVANAELLQSTFRLSFPTACVPCFEPDRKLSSDKPDDRYHQILPV